MFFELAARLRQQENPKPLILIKAGKSKSGQRAAQSHTGALTESDEVLDHLFEQYGIVRMDDLESLFYAAQVLSSQPIPADKRLCIITNAGGPGIITADAAEKMGLQVPELSDELQQKLEKHLPRTASLTNPIDLVGDATAERYKKVLEELVESDEVDILHILCTRQLMTDMEAIAESIASYAERARERKKTILATFADFNPESEMGRIMHEKGIPYFQFSNNAIRACAAAMQYGKAIAKPVEETETFYVKKDSVVKLLKLAEERGNCFLTEPKAYKILQVYGLETAPYKLVKSKEEAGKAASELGYPLVAKVVSVQIEHKSDAGGVMTGIEDEEDLLKAYNQIHENVKEKKPEAELEGILLQKMVQGGTEFIMGARHSEKYGHLLMFGVGGIFVEVLKDVTFRRVPIFRSDAMAMIEGIRAKKMLEGERGRPAVDKNALVDFLLRLGQLVQDFPQIRELDINPVFGLKKGVVAADARFLVR